MLVDRAAFCLAYVRREILLWNSFHFFDDICELSVIKASKVDESLFVFWRAERRVSPEWPCGAGPDRVWADLLVARLSCSSLEVEAAVAVSGWSGWRPSRLHHQDVNHDVISSFPLVRQNGCRRVPRRHGGNKYNRCSFKETGGRRFRIYLKMTWWFWTWFTGCLNRCYGIKSQ